MGGGRLVIEWWEVDQKSIWEVEGGRWNVGGGRWQVDSTGGRYRRLAPKTGRWWEVDLQTGGRWKVGSQNR